MFSFLLFEKVTKNTKILRQDKTYHKYQTSKEKEFQEKSCIKIQGKNRETKLVISQKSIILSGYEDEKYLKDKKDAINFIFALNLLVFELILYDIFYFLYII